MDLKDLTPVLTADGPFVTVHVETESAVEQAQPKHEAQWRNVLRELRDRGVDDQTLAVLEDARGSHDEGASRLVVASAADHQVKLAVSMSTVPRRPVVDVSPLPHLLGLIDELGRRVPHLVVHADHDGADVTAWYDQGHLRSEVTLTGGPTIYRNPSGGSWSHLHHEFPVQRGWLNRMGKDVAQGIAELAAAVGAELVIGSGEPAALAVIAEQLPTELARTWQTVEGGRGHDGGEQLVRQRVEDLLARHVTDRGLELIADFAQERGQLDRACEGIEGVVAALRKAQVQTLLVTTAADQDQRLWFGPDGSMVALSAQELRDLGVESPQQGPAVDVLIRAALATGADVQLVPHEMEQTPQGGVGALLRYADSDSLAALP